MRRSADQLVRVLKGAKAGELAIVKSAKALGLAIPASVLQRADRVIQ